MTRHRTKDIEAIDGVSVDIEVEGEEDTAEKVMMELKDYIGWIAEAYDQEVPPGDLETRSDEHTPLMGVNWDAVFDTDGDSK